MPDRSDRTPPRTLLTAADLAPQSVCHFTENPYLAAAIARTVDACLVGGRRFPHTVIAGPADAGKRALVAAIARDMCEPLFEVEMSTVTGLHDLHAVFRGCPDRGIVLISGLEPHHAVFGRAIAQAAHRQRLVVSSLPPELGLPDMSPPEMTPPARARGARRYADFTIIGTMRIPPDAADARVRWVERTYFTWRTRASESVRIGRALQRAGFTVAPEAVERISGAATECGIRTLAAATAVAEWMAANGTSELGPELSLVDLAPVLSPLARVPWPFDGVDHAPDHASRARRRAAKALQESE